MKKQILSLTSVLFTLSLLSLDAWGQEGPPFQEQLIYSLNLFNGREYTNSFMPLTEGSLYVLADEYNVLTPRITQVFYSNSNNRYDLQLRNLDVSAEGALELLKGNKVVQTIEKTPYAFYYAQAYYSGTSEIFLGERAEGVAKQYQEAVDKYYEQLRKFYDQQAQYQKDLDEYYRKLRRAGAAGAQITPPVEPKPPQPPSYYVTPVAEAFVLKLSSGEYRIRLRLKDGTIAEDSEKRVVAFKARRRGRVGFEVIPEESWTSRKTTSDPGDIFYLLGQVVFYFRPFIQDEYNDLYYAKLEDPQNSGSIEKWRWANISQVKSGLIQLWKGKEIAGRVGEKPYYVEQTPGPELGYKIVDFDPAAEEFAGRSPTFVGYRIDIDPSGGRYALNLLDSEENKVVPGSFREARSVRFSSARERILYSISLLPLIIGIPVIIWRRMVR